MAANRFMGLTIPPLKHFGPLLVIWGAAMLMLVVIRDLGSSLMLFGAFLVMVYVATNRFSYVLAGLALFLVGAMFMGAHVAHVQDRFEIWRDPFQNPQHAPLGIEQIQRSLFEQADGGLFGEGFGQSLLKLPGPFFPTRSHRQFPCGSFLPAPHTGLHLVR